MPAEKPLDLKEIAMKLDHLMPMPEIFSKIIRELNNPESNSATLEIYFKHDPNLSLEILKLANSAYYGMPGKVTNIRAAVVLLGMKQIKSLVLHTLVSRFLAGDSSQQYFSGRALWMHSIGVGLCAKMICRRLGLKNSEDFFTMGSVHDVGLFIEHRFYPQIFKQIVTRICNEESRIVEVERQIFGTDHAALTQLLCSRWNIPEPLSHVMTFHHTPMEAPEHLRISAAVIYMANYITNKNAFGFHYASADLLTDDLYKLLNINQVDVEVLEEDFMRELPDLTQFLNA